MTTETLYFVSRQPQLGAGTIQPGNWARGFSNYSAKRVNGGDPWFLIIELTYENYRLQHCAQLPCRAASTFSFLSIDAAKTTASQAFWGNVPMAIWACEMVRPEAPRHIGNSSLFTAIDGLTFPQVADRARQYWTEEHPELVQEFVTTSPLRLLEVVHRHVPGEGWR